MSRAVISRLTGGPNLIPRLSLNVYVLPPFVGAGTLTARSGTSLLPAAPATWFVPTSVRTSRFEWIAARPRVGLARRVEARPSPEVRVPSQPTRYVPPSERGACDGAATRP